MSAPQCGQGTLRCGAADGVWEVERLAALLHSGQSGDYRGMPPGSIAVLEFSGEAVIEPGAARLSAFWWP